MDVTETADEVRPRAVAAAVTGGLPLSAALHPAGAMGTRVSPAVEQRYRQLLYRHLTGSPVREIEFFINSRRFDLMRGLIGAELARPGLRLLNVASGPFAFELYAARSDAFIDAFDSDIRLEGLHSDLVHHGLIANSRFEVLDIGSFRAGGTYDIVLVNDLFYAPGLDFFALFQRVADAVKPGGLIYFDIQDERAGPVWALFKKTGSTRRYDLSKVRQAVEGLGFEIEAVAPSLGIKGGLDYAVRRLLWSIPGIANNFAFAARRTL